MTPGTTQIVITANFLAFAGIRETSPSLAVSENAGFCETPFLIAVARDFAIPRQGSRHKDPRFRPLELAQSLVQVITGIRDTLQSYCQNYCPSNLSFLALLSRVDDFARHNQSWTRYLKATTIQGTIGQYRKQLDGLKADFTLITIMHLSMKIFSERAPHQLIGYTWEHSEPVRLIDAMNTTIDLPFDLCSTPHDFADLVKFLFRKHRGRSYVERGQYALTIGDKESNRIDNILWRKHVRPGHTITMNILIRKSDTKASEGDGYDDSDEAYVKCFRRFHVVLENSILLDHFIAPAT
ncbi:hypothetical protein C0995_005316, partial [Termitomyces sp. Mi166